MKNEISPEQQLINAYLNRQPVPAWQKACKGKGANACKGKGKRVDYGFNTSGNY